MYLIVGLGNPGREYYSTRHNIGFRVIDRISQVCGISLDREKFGVVYGRGSLEDVPVILAKPVRYMNMSGPPTRRIADYFKVSMSDLLVIHDDIDFPFGKIKLKIGGGHAGHNGLRSLIDAFGSGSFSRIRIGTGRPETGRNVVDHVLGRFTPQEEDLLDALLADVQNAVDAVILRTCRDCGRRTRCS